LLRTLFSARRGFIPKIIMSEQFYEEQSIPEIRSENREEVERKLLGRICNEMRKIIEKTDYRYRSSRKRGAKRRIFNREIEKKFLLPLRNRLCREFPEDKMLIYTLANLDRSCKWQHVATRLLSEKIRDKRMAKSFWNELFSISRMLDYPHYATEGAKAGVLGQAGICLVFRKLEIPYKVANPTKDAKEKTDILVGQERVQVKRHEKRETHIEHLVQIYYPSIVTETTKEETHWVNENLEKISTVQESCEDRSKNVGRKVRCLRIICPEGSLDLYTGQPTEKFLNLIKPEINKYLQQYGQA